MAVADISIWLKFKTGAPFATRTASGLTEEEARSHPFAKRPEAIVIRENGDTRRRDCLPLKVLEAVRIELAPDPSREPEHAGAD